jgi:hypothetical protein
MAMPSYGDDDSPLEGGEQRVPATSRNW